MSPKGFISITTSLLLFMPLLFPSTSSANGSTALPTAYDSKKYTGHIDVMGKLGNDRSLGRVSLFVPLYQKDDSLTFIDLRTLTYFGSSDTSKYEINAGLAYRQQVLDRKWIAGGYVFYDHSRTRNENNFNQLTVGGEMMNEYWKTHLNFYIPLTSNKSVSKNDKTSLGGHNVFIEKGIEAAMTGLDVEIGRTIDPIPGLSGFLTGFHFFDDDVKNITGGRLRFEYSLNDAIYRNNETNRNWFLENLTLTGEAQYDEVRKTDGFIGLILRIPFGKTDYTRLSKLDRRMTDMIVRDIDIVVNTGSEEPTAILDANGQPITNCYANKTNPNTGYETIENPLKE